MKTKLTITIDEDLVPQAKLYAASRGVSLSHVIEQALRAMSVEQAGSFAERWRGRFRSTGRKDPRYRALAKKYL